VLQAGHERLKKEERVCAWACMCGGVRVPMPAHCTDWVCLCPCGDTCPPLCAMPGAHTASWLRALSYSCCPACGVRGLTCGHACVCTCRYACPWMCVRERRHTHLTNWLTCKLVCRAALTPHCLRQRRAFCCLFFRLSVCQSTWEVCWREWRAAMPPAACARARWCLAA
jgi:hypothetical protein